MGDRQEAGKAKTCVEVAEELGYDLQYENNGWGKICCPRHDDRDPSLRIAPDGAYWKCMVCEKGGGSIHLARWLSDCSFEDAVSMVMSGVDGDPLLSYHLSIKNSQGRGDLPQRMMAWGMRYRLLTREQVDDILMSDAPEAMLSYMLSGAVT